jgi:hypothetical protein
MTADFGRTEAAKNSEAVKQRVRQGHGQIAISPLPN